MAGKRQTATARARERARQARAALDDERAERERQVEQLTTEYYLGEADASQAAAAVASADLRRARAVTQLLELEDPACTARLCGLTRAEVNRLRRIARDVARCDPEETVEDVLRPGLLQ